MKAMSASKVIVGLNAALQKRFIMPTQDLVPGNVHRASTVQTGVGGKGQDVAIAMNCLSPNSPDVKLAQFVGQGATGDAVFDLLVETLGESALDLTVRTKQDTRICTSIVAADETTELVEPSGVIEEGEMNNLMNKLEEETDASALCIMGSMPPGCSDDTYAEIYSRTAGSKTLCLVDSVAGVEPLLKQVAASSESTGPTVFKVNASELCNLAGCKKSSSETGGITLSELTEAIDQFKKKFAPSASALTGLAITDGRHPGYFASFSNNDEVALFKLPIPVLEPGKPLFPIGAGDAVAGGTLAAWLCLVENNDSTLSDSCLEILKQRFEANSQTISDPELNAIVSAFSFGLACGSASKFLKASKDSLFLSNWQQN